jgi:hypothetical protein
LTYILDHATTGTGVTGDYPDKNRYQVGCCGLGVKLTTSPSKKVLFRHLMKSRRLSLDLGCTATAVASANVCRLDHLHAFL